MIKRTRVVPDPNQMTYGYDIKEEMENTLLERIAAGIGEEHLKQFSEHEAQTLLFGLRSWNYIELRFIRDGDSGKILTLFSITEAGRKYVEVLRRNRLERSLGG